MPKTPSSLPTSLITLGEFLKRVDWRPVADLLSDTGQRFSFEQLAGNEALQAAFDAAMGEVESACLCGNRYSPADLAALTGVGRAMLYKLLTDLTLMFLYDRRPTASMPSTDMFKRAMAKLEQLRHGERVFSLQETMDAGEVDHEVEDRADVDARNLTTVQASRFFGVRGPRR